MNDAGKTLEEAGAAYEAEFTEIRSYLGIPHPGL
jgi:hypothetical protein